jgi:hypothetical protein
MKTQVETRFFRKLIAAFTTSAGLSRFVTEAYNQGTYILKRLVFERGRAKIMAISGYLPNSNVQNATVCEFPEKDPFFTG